MIDFCLQTTSADTLDRFFSYPLPANLRDAREHLDVTLVNSSKNRVIADATVKIDRIDAKRLAHMLQTDMLAESHVPSDEIRERDLVRTRKSLVRNGQLRKTA